MDTFITDSTGLGVNVIPPGIQRFHLHLLKNNTNDNTDTFCTIELANSAGTSYGTVLSTNQSAIGYVSGSIPVEVAVDLVIPTSFYVLPTDRMIVKIYVVDQSSGNHVIEMLLGILKVLNIILMLLHH